MNFFSLQALQTIFSLHRMYKTLFFARKRKMVTEKTKAIGKKSRVSKESRLIRIKNKYHKKEMDRKRSLAFTIKARKGKRLSYVFVCAFCKHTHTKGYSYKISNEEFDICSFCYDSIYKKKYSTKLIYTPMGNNQ